MIIKPKFYCLLFTLMFLVSCSSKEKSDEYKITVDLIINKKEYNIPLNYQVKKESVKERKLINIDLELDFTIGSIQDTMLLSPSFVKTDKKGNIYILDFADCKVKKYTPDGIHLDSFGKMGRGPGEVNQAFRMAVSPNSDIAIIDPNLQKCVCFSEGKSYDIKLKYHPDNVTFLDNEICFYQKSELKNFSTVSRHSFNGTQTKQYKSLIDLSPYSNVPPFITVLEGNILSHKNEVFYIPVFMNHIVAFAEEGNYKFAVETIDEIKEYPKVVVGNSPGGIIFSKPPDRSKYTTMINCGIVKDKIWIASYPGYKKYKKKVFDFYSVKNGKYLYSYITGDIGSSRSIHLSSEKIFVVGAEGTVSVFKYSSQNR